MEIPADIGFIPAKWVMTVASYENYEDPTNFIFPELVVQGKVNLDWGQNHEFTTEDYLDVVKQLSETLGQALADKTGRPDVFLAPSRISVVVTAETGFSFYAFEVDEEVPEEPTDPEEEGTPTP